MKILKFLGIRREKLSTISFDIGLNTPSTRRKIENFEISQNLSYKFYTCLPLLGMEALFSFSIAATGRKWTTDGLRTP